MRHTSGHDEEHKDTEAKIEQLKDQGNPSNSKPASGTGATKPSDSTLIRSGVPRPEDHATASTGLLRGLGDSVQIWSDPASAFERRSTAGVPTRMEYEREIGRPRGPSGPRHRAGETVELPLPPSVPPSPTRYLLPSIQIPDAVKESLGGPPRPEFAGTAALAGGSGNQQSAQPPPAPVSGPVAPPPPPAARPGASSSRRPLPPTPWIARPLTPAEQKTMADEQADVPQQVQV